MRASRRKPGPAPSLASTGHAGDDELLAQIARHSDLEAGRHWVHYVYVPDEDAARRAAEHVTAHGWDVQRVERSAAGGPEWVVIAERHGAVTPPTRSAPHVSSSSRSPRPTAEAATTAGRPVCDVPGRQATCPRSATMGA